MTNVPEAHNTQDTTGKITSMTANDLATTKSTRPFNWQRLWPLAVLALGLGLFFGLGVNRYVTFEALRDNRAWLLDFVAARPIGAVLLYIVVYAAAVAFSIPGAAVLTVTGGFLFGIWLGTAAAVVAATIGAIGVFLATQTVLGSALRERAGPVVKRLEDGFKENALSYLFVLRLIPAIPFFLVNIVPAVLGVPLRTFVIATFFGIIPGSFVFNSIGAGLGSIFDQGKEFSLEGALTPQVVTALLGLVVLSLLPVAYKAWKARRAQ